MSDVDQLRDEELELKHKWMAAKKRLKRQKSKVAVDSDHYIPWPANRKADYVLVYKPLKPAPNPKSDSPMLNLTSTQCSPPAPPISVQPDPRPLDLDDKEETRKGEKANEASVLRFNYILALRDNDLSVEIENFISGMVEYRAIKIYGKKDVMDHWAEKFLLMKPVRPPSITHTPSQDSLDSTWDVAPELPQGVAPDNERYYKDEGEIARDKSIKSRDTNMTSSQPVTSQTKPPAAYARATAAVAVATLKEGGAKKRVNIEEEKKGIPPAASSLYPDTRDLEDGSDSDEGDGPAGDHPDNFLERRKRWGRLRSIVRGGPKELKTKNMLAMYNEVYYTYDEKAVQEEHRERHFPTLSSAAKTIRVMMNHVIRRGDSVDQDAVDIRVCLTKLTHRVWKFCTGP
eukprot:sb/3465350/